MEKNKIAIGICTYKRPEMLKQCLKSLCLIKRPDNSTIFIIIADNDLEGTASHVIDDFRVMIDIPIYYAIEKNRGIPFARNNILNQCKDLGITALAFIDDDEYVDKSWLYNLWEYYKNTKADVVRGFVKTVYPQDTPVWIIKGKYYQRKAFKEGEIQSSASTNNVLFDFKKLCIENKMVFDETFGMKGGSDSDFFRKVYKAGLTICATNNAVVYEELDRDRFKISYLLKRKFRTRNLKISFNDMTIKKWSRILLSALFDIAKGIVSLPINCFKGKHKIIASLCNLTTGIAKLLGLFRIHIIWEEYKK